METTLERVNIFQRDLAVTVDDFRVERPGCNCIIMQLFFQRDLAMTVDDFRVERPGCNPYLTLSYDQFGTANEPLICRSFARPGCDSGTSLEILLHFFAWLTCYLFAVDHKPYVSDVWLKHR